MTDQISGAKKPRILILSSAEIDETRDINDRFVAELNSRLGNDLQIEWHNYHDICIEMDTSGMSVWLIDGTDVKDFAFVYVKSYFRFHEAAYTIAEYLDEVNVPYSATELRNYVPYTKLTQLARLARKHLPIPHTVYMPTEHFQSAYQQLVSKLGSEFIFKAIDGSTGNDNHLIKSEEQLQAVLVGQEQTHFIAQNFIANESDMRVLVIGGKVELVIDRRRKDNTTHLNNTSQGAEASLIALEDFPKELIDLSLQAAKIMDRGVAGVDLMLESGTDNPYIIEVNASPQIASGAFEAQKLDIYTKYFKNVI